MVLFEQDDEWRDGRRYFLPSMARMDAGPAAEVVGPALRLASLTIRRTDDAVLHHVLGLDLWASIVHTSRQPRSTLVCA